MNDCQRLEPLVTELLFGDLTGAERAELDRHLAGCEGCARRVEEMTATLAIAARRERPDPGAKFWAGFTGRVEERIARGDVAAQEAVATGAAAEDRSAESRGRTILHRLRAPGPLSWAAALAFLAIGLVLGRTFLAPVPPGPPTAADDQLRDDETAVLARTAVYLGRSKMLLLDLEHFDPATDGPAILNLSKRREIAAELVREAADLDVRLAEARERRLRSLVADLEEILVQIANLEAESDAPAIEMLRSGVDQKAVLFRIDVEELRSTAPTRRDDTGPTTSV